MSKFDEEKVVMWEPRSRAERKRNAFLNLIPYEQWFTELNIQLIMLFKWMNV